MEVVKELDPDTAGRHASLFVQILSFAFTRGSLDNLVSLSRSTNPAQEHHLRSR